MPTDAMSRKTNDGLTLVAFQKRCHETNNYSEDAICRGALFAGLAGEAGEVCDAFLKLEFGKGTPESDKELARLSDSVAMEVCDCLWYAVELCWSFGFDLEKNIPIDVLALFGVKAECPPTISEIQSNVKEAECWMVAMNLSAIAGETIECYKKMLRDDNGRWTKDRITLVYRHVINLISCTILLWESLGYDAEDMCNKLINKLARRALEGKISGSGSDR